MRATPRGRARTCRLRLFAPRKALVPPVQRGKSLPNALGGIAAEYQRLNLPHYVEYPRAPTNLTLRSAMMAAGEKPASVTDIFVSHAHGDHIGGLVTPTGALAFPNATIHISAPEWKWLSGLSEDEAKNFGIYQVSALVSAIKPKVVPFEPGADLLHGIVNAVELKGRAPGHSGYRIGSGADNVLVFGDAMHSFLVSVRKPSRQLSGGLIPTIATGAVRSRGLEPLSG